MTSTSPAGGPDTSIDTGGSHVAPVFISYSHADLEFAERLTRDLQALGVQCFIDQTGLQKGTPDWDEAIRQAVRTSSAVLLVASQLSRQSRFVRSELDVASMYQRRIYPVWANGDQFVDCVPLGMSSVQYIDARGDRYSTSLKELVAELTRLAIGRDGAAQHAPTQPTFEPRNPYKGLRPFTEADVADFFGCTRIVDELVEALRQALDSHAERPIRLLAVVGPSGSGKSSVVMAGLVPRLKNNVLPGSAEWLYLDPLRPGSHPIENLALALARRLDRSVASIHADLDDESARGLHTTASLLSRTRDQRVVIVLDQFEEIFTQTTDVEQRRQFIDLLNVAVTERAGPLLVVLTLRADFYHHGLDYPELWPLLEAHACTIEPMALDDLREVIEAPARLPDTQLTFEANLVGDMLFEVRDRQRAVVSALPLLQFTLDQLFQSREGHRLTEGAYRSLGGVRGALAKHAEDTYASLPSDAHRQLARELFLRLIDLGSGEGEVTRRRLAVHELDLAEPEKRRVIGQTAEIFVAARLLTISAEQGGTSMLEVSHEALISAWDRLRRWSAENQAEQLLQRALTQAAQDWQERAHDGDLLYRGARLAEIEEWRGHEDVTLNALELQFLQASFELRDAEQRAVDERREKELRDAQQLAGVQRRAARLLRWLAAVLAVGLVVSLVAAGVAVTQRAAADEATRAADAARDEAVRQQQVATSREFAATAEGQLGVDPEVGVMLAIEAARVLPTAEAERALRQTLEASQVRLALAGHAGDVLGVGYSPDGRLLVSCGADGTVRVWDAQTGQQLRQMSHTQSGPVFSAVFGPDSRQVLTASADNTARLWDAQTGRELGDFEGHQSGLYSAAFRSDGQQVVTASDDGTARIWDVQTRRELRTLSGHVGAVRAAEFSPDGQMVATAGEDGTARLWDVQSGRELREVRGQSARIGAVAFSPDGQTLATGGGDWTARIWDVGTGQEVRQFTGHSEQVTSVAFSQDGQQLLTAADDGTALVWEADNGRQLVELRGRPGSVYRARFAPDGQRIATADADGSVRVYALSNEDVRQLIGHTDSVFGVAFAPDDRIVATAGGDSTVRLWDPRTGQALRTLTGHTGAVYAPSFSPDGTRLVSASDDSTVRVWDVETGNQLLQLNGHTGIVARAAFSPDGQRIVSAGRDGTARVWDAQTGRELIRVRPNGGTSLWSASFSPDGRQVITTGEDATARIIDAQTGQEVQKLAGHTGPVVWAAYSSDGQRVLTAGLDGTAREWDAATGREVRQLLGHTGPVLSAAFSVDGQLVATAGLDGTARIWDASSGVELWRLRHAGAVFGVDFSRSGDQVVTGSQSGTKAQVWTLGCELTCPIDQLLAFAHGRVTRELTPGEREQFLHQARGTS